MPADQAELPYKEGDDCGECGHPFDPHIFVIVEQNSGLYFCQDPDCTCVGTWSIHGFPKPEMPSPEIVEAFRREALASDVG